VSPSKKGKEPLELTLTIHTTEHPKNPRRLKGKWNVMLSPYFFCLMTGLPVGLTGSEDPLHLFDGKARKTMPLAEWVRSGRLDREILKAMSKKKRKPRAK
jgi:hypothetical protein